MTLWGRFPFFIGGIMTEWILVLMTQLEPKTPWVDTYPKTAAAIAEAAKRDPLFAGDEGITRTAVTLVSLAWFESKFQPDAMGDKGKSCGAFQIQPSTSGLSCDVLRDPDLAAPEAIRLMRQSFRICRARPLEERLAWYAGGSASCDRGLRHSRHRMALARNLESRAKTLAKTMGHPPEDEASEIKETDITDETRHEFGSPPKGDDATSRVHPSSLDVPSRSGESGAKSEWKGSDSKGSGQSERLRRVAQHRKTAFLLRLRLEAHRGLWHDDASDRGR